MRYKWGRLLFLLMFLVACSYPALAALSPDNFLYAASDAVESNGNKSGTELLFWGNGYFGTEIKITQPGQYRLFFRGSSTGATDESGGRYPIIIMNLNGKTFSSVTVPSPRENRGIYFSTVLDLMPGNYNVRFEYNNDYGNDIGEDRNFFVDWFGIFGVPDPITIPEIVVEGKKLQEWGDFFYATKATSVNLLPNPSFEVEQGGGWEWFSFGSGTGEVNLCDKTEALFGNSSASIRNATTDVIVVKHQVPVDPRQAYVFSAWIKTKFISPDMRAELRILWWRGDWISVGGFLSSEPLKGDNDWTFVSMVITPQMIPSNADWGSIALRVVGEPGSVGVAYFDGVSFSRIDKLERPATPELANNFTGGDFNLEWDRTDDPLIGYYLYKGDQPNFKIDPKNYFQIIQGNAFTLPQEQEISYYKLVAINNNFVPSLPSNEVKSDELPPSPVANLTIDSVTNKGAVELKWIVPEAAPDGDLPAKYRIYRSTNAENIMKNSAAVVEITKDDDGYSATTGEEVEVLIPVPAGIYYYVVTVIDKAGNESGPSNIVSGETVADNELPLAPVAPKIYVNEGPNGNVLPKGLVLLQWQEQDTAASDGDWPRYFLVYRSRSSNPLSSGSVIGKVKGTQMAGELLEFRDTTVIDGGTYYYLIRAVDKAGNQSGNDDVYSAKPLKPIAARVLTPVAQEPILNSEENSTLEIIWEPISDPVDTVQKYQVQYCRDSKFEGNVSVYDTYTEDLVVETVSANLPLEPLRDGIWYLRVVTYFQSGVISYSEPLKVAIIQPDLSNRQRGAISYVEISPKVLRETDPANIFIRVKKETKISVVIFDARGRAVKRLLTQTAFPDEVVTLEWDGRDNAGRLVPDGLYFVQVKGDSLSEPASVVVKRIQVWHR